MSELSYALSSAKRTTDTPLAICTAAFDVFQRHEDACEQHIGSDACDNWASPYPGIVGGTYDDFEEDVNFSIGIYLPYPKQAGCDPTTLGVPLTPTPTFAPYIPATETTSQPIDVGSFTALESARYALFHGHPEQVSTLLKAVHSPDALEAAGYIQALADEFINRPDAALGYYTSELVNGDPASPWVMLAKLHLPPLS